MGSFSGLGIGLSFLFGCVILGFVAELYYLLLWKKQREDVENQNLSSSNYTPTHLSSCFKNPNSSNTQQKDLQNCVNEIESRGKQQNSTQKDPPLKGFGEESLDLELMRLHNLCGPPRFLFTINEETKEDLESDSRKGSRTRSLSELLCTPETPICCSSPLKGPQAPNLEGYLNPLYDSDTNEFELNKVRSSPPPTFKFLRDAEEKLLKKLMELEAEKRGNLRRNQDGDCSRKTEVEGKMVKREGGIHHLQMSASSQLCVNEANMTRLLKGNDTQKG
ncbi:uncharacterized protein LOC112518305 [Cynara cardunculus var. scolymus]|uniref:Transmembrane protein n=1 Tax=Cynara cardunculus var. scolymus TaxID=59895 RepID=A0A124SCR7_CYNCS|nr:uncharacterized protein LOC112518305 [Cynara cardunculus var. scolymus]KVH94617.1 hypothetical protein Ccrd_003317 [Cynara cardunculus var. scolymus]